MNCKTDLANLNENRFLNSTQYLGLADFLTTKEVAKIIHKSPAWLERKRTEGGGIPFRKVGHHVLYSKYDAFNYLYSAPILESTSDNSRSAQMQAIEKTQEGGVA
jgi:hypothetical protein